MPCHGIYFTCCNCIFKCSGNNDFALENVETKRFWMQQFGIHGISFVLIHSFLHALQSFQWRIWGFMRVSVQVLKLEGTYADSQNNSSSAWRAAAPQHATRRVELYLNIVLSPCGYAQGLHGRVVCAKHLTSATLADADCQRQREVV